MLSLTASFSAGAGRLGHRLEVVEDAHDLGVDALDHGHACRVEADLARHVDGVADLHGLRIGADGGGSGGGGNDLAAHDGLSGFEGGELAAIDAQFLEFGARRFGFLRMRKGPTWTCASMRRLDAMPSLSSLPRRSSAVATSLNGGSCTTWRVAPDRGVIESTTDCAGVPGGGAAFSGAGIGARCGGRKQRGVHDPGTHHAHQHQQCHHQAVGATAGISIGVNLFAQDALRSNA
jgi:hypothetical protein